jgi:hypothetical protein
MMLRDEMTWIARRTDDNHCMWKLRA